jgi:hypothetical protein
MIMTIFIRNEFFTIQKDTLISMKLHNRICCLFLLIMSFTYITANAQNRKITSILRSLPIPDKPKNKVLILGLPHFDNTTNASDVRAAKVIDMLTPANQKEIEDVVQQLKKFNPTKICIEWEEKLDSTFESRYKKYYTENTRLPVGEYYQIGFRLAKAMGHSKLYCIDSRPPQSAAVRQIDDIEKYAKQYGGWEEMNSYTQLNNAFNKYTDSVRYLLNLKDYVLFGNSDAVKQQFKRLWFTGLVHVGNKQAYAGADITGNWYTRNTRIFSNVKKISTEPEERILIIYGMSHAFILEEIFRASHEFVVTEIKDIIK